MDWNRIVLATDDEISRLQQAKALLNGAPARTPEMRKPKQPAAATVAGKATSFNPAEF